MPIIRNPAYAGADKKWLQNEADRTKGKIEELQATISWCQSRVRFFENNRSEMMAEIAFIDAAQTPVERQDGNKLTDED